MLLLVFSLHLFHISLPFIFHAISLSSMSSLLLMSYKLSSRFSSIYSCYMCLSHSSSPCHLCCCCHFFRSYSLSSFFNIVVCFCSLLCCEASMSYHFMPSFVLFFVVVYSCYHFSCYCHVLSCLAMSLLPFVVVP